ncbi:MAG TPA: metalloregulator ArsR/SmtB family transcription factor [Patescibacteria group bacterium]|nr:metalloregulator ArsR/SmtB family transcription factor [Patescibacteria group bacterium]
MNNFKNATDTVIILPETDDHTLCVELTGLIRREDFRRSFKEPLQKIIENNGFYDVLIHHLPDFKGWEEDAADLSMQTVIESAKYGRRRAMINAPEKFILMQKMSGEVFGGETRYFGPGQFQAALNWVKGREQKGGRANALEERRIEIEQVENSSELAAGLLKVMANDKRLMILCKLYEGEKSVKDLMVSVGMEQSALSQHLSLMREKRIVKTRRDKQSIYYSLANQPIEDLMRVLSQIYKS